MEKSADAFRTISEVAEDLAVPQHVLRFWETRFPQIRPLKRAGGRRYYRPPDVALLRQIRTLLYDEGYTIKGVQRLLKDKGGKGVPVQLEGAAEPDDVEVADEVFEPASAEIDGLDGPELSLDEAAPPDPLRHALGVLQLAAAHAKSASNGFPALHELLAEIEECQRILKAVRR